LGSEGQLADGISPRGRAALGGVKGGVMSARRRIRPIAKGIVCEYGAFADYADCDLRDLRQGSPVEVVLPRDGKSRKAGKPKTSAIKGVRDGGALHG